MNVVDLLKWKRAEVRRTRDRVEDFERAMRGRTFTELEQVEISLSLRARWASRRYAERKLEEFLVWLDAEAMRREPGTGSDTGSSHDDAGRSEPETVGGGR